MSFIERVDNIMKSLFDNQLSVILAALSMDSACWREHGDRGRGLEV
jgi:hypothetical protein